MGLLLVDGFAGSVMACPVCFGNLDSPTGDGMNLAILFLLVVTGGVLAAFGSFFVYIRKRAGLIADPARPGTQVISNKETV